MKRKGFTLVELLIVIVVIGILSAMMMLSSSEAVSSARAAQITANMRSLQTAALAYYMDNMATADSASTSNEDRWKGILRYLKDEEKAEIGDSDYSLDTGHGWHIKYTFRGGAASDTRLKEKVKGRAAALGLKNSNAVNPIAIYNGGDSVYLQVR